MAVIKLDHQQVVQTSWKPHSQQCWDHRASIDLDRVGNDISLTPVLAANVLKGVYGSHHMVEGFGLVGLWKSFYGANCFHSSRRKRMFKGGIWESPYGW